MTTIHAVFSNALGPTGVARTLTELLDVMPVSDPGLQLWFPQGASNITRDYHRPIFNRQVWRAICKTRVPISWQGWAVTNAALRNIREGDVVYVWPPYSHALIAGARNRGAIVVAERINCMGLTCKVVLERAYAHIGKRLPRGWCTPKGMAEEQAQMALCNYVTAPNPMVAQSLIDAGIPADRILETSYGWSPARLAGAVNVTRPDRKPTFAFVGLRIIRKGLNLLLEAWKRADVDGRLLLAGNIDDDIREVCSRHLALPSVEQLGFVRDISNVYAAADVFVFPSHEEGGPQVTYEAAACGLPSIVSAMGAGRIVRNQTEGFVVDPFDIDGWIHAIRTMASEPTLRRDLGLAASQRSMAFTWQQVGSRLYGLLGDVARGKH
jgi:glycosyltransferase involved in cell wall biosynthesis